MDHSSSANSMQISSRKKKMTSKKRSSAPKSFVRKKNHNLTPKRKYVTDNDSKVVRIKYEDLEGIRNEKKKAISQLHSLHDILGASHPPDEEELELEKLVLGGNIEEFESEAEEEKLSESASDPKPKLDRKAAWEDEDDERILISEKAKTLKNCHRSVSVRGDEKYADFVQEKFVKMMGAPKWAELGNEENDELGDSDDELLKKTGNYVVKSDSLPKGMISIRKCPSLSDKTLAGSVIKSVEFHPTSKVALAAGTNGNITLFQIDGKLNNKIQSVFLDKFPVHNAHFSVEGTEIVAGSNMYAHFYCYDMMAGKVTRVPWEKGMEQRNIKRFQMSPDGKYIVIHGRYGNMHLVTASTKEWVGSLKMNGEVIAITFNKDGSKMFSHGNTGEVYVWDMASRTCIHKFTDEGCISGTAVSLSPNEQFLATGSDVGIVNVYETSSVFSSSNPEPLKVLKNLTTEINSMRFNSTSEILAFSSQFKKNGIKLVHLSSMSVFSNFPTMEEKMLYPHSLGISLNSGYLSIGNNVGTAYIYRLKHYKNY